MVLSAVLFLAALTSAQTVELKETAVTFDDLPVAGGSANYSERLEITEKLVYKLKSLNIPAIGFVNEFQLYNNNGKNEQEIGLLNKWAEAGLELGNHTYSHSDFHKISPDSFEADVLKGELITKTIYKPGQKITRYFRHPFLHTGLSVAARRNFAEFLEKHNYKTAPVTIDNSDWIFSIAYNKAITKSDTAAAGKIAGAYIPYIISKFRYFEKNTIKLFGRPIKQILLLHANRLNADNIDKLAEALKNNGYNFITVEKALTDSAFQSADTWVGKGGISWIDRWALSRGFKGEFFKEEPTCPEFVMKAAGVASE